MISALMVVMSLSGAAQPDRPREAIFASTRGWIGADGNYSIRRSQDKSLWFFGDTWIGEVRNGKRINAAMINNSVGVLDRGRMNYAWGTSAGKPAAFLLPADGHGWIWPFAGVCIDKKVHVLLYQMEKAPGSEAFGFRNFAVWHAVIDNPDDAPEAWRIHQTKFPFSEIGATQRLFGAAMLTVGDDVYIYGVLERPRQTKAMILARVPARSFADYPQWRFRTADGWSRDFKDAAPLVDGVASEYSVTRHGDRFVLVTHEAMLSPKIVARSAAAPDGPWSPAVALYRSPEANWSKNVFCYAAKAHPAFNTNDTLVISYAANSHKFSDLLDDARLYWPRFITVKVPK